MSTQELVEKTKPPRKISAKTRRHAIKTLTESLAAIYVHKRKVAAALEVLGLHVRWADELKEQDVAP